MAPIRPENKARYPKDWKEIREQILARAENRCEWPGCRVENGKLGTWRGERFIPIFETTGDEIEASLKIVLTIAHLDHTPENCDPENLRAWCQRHHNRYDAKMRADGIKRRAAQAAGQGQLFELKTDSKSEELKDG
jgi:hypothetical protein